MGIGETNDPVGIQSSIALLQERFRRLQKVKEMREERQLLKLLTEPNNKVMNPTASPPPSYSEQLGFFFSYPDVMVNNIYPTCSSPPQLSLSLWPSPRSNYSHLRCVDAPAVVPSLWPGETTTLRISSTKYRDYDHLHDVDTSLHL